MTYPGGKNGSGVYQKIINQMPPHNLYVEPFLGHGAIMRLKRPSIASIGIDVDGDVIEAWRGMIIPPNLTILHADAITWLARTKFSSDTLIYCDPPYLMGTRSSPRQIYRYEMSEKDHERLVRIINGLPCMIMISGYWSEMYARALNNWRTVTFTTRTRGGKIAHEWLWMNFPEPLELHDYRYLGDNFRERERIQRKTKRWKRKLINMTPLERHAIMAAIAEIRISSPSVAMADRGDG